MTRGASMSARLKLAGVVLVCLCTLLANPSRSWGARLALLVGNDEGHGADVRLRYAQSDTARLAMLLSRVGGFAPDGIAVQLGRTANELRQALADLSARMQALPGQHLVVFYYSGHADGQNLHLGTSSYPLADLRQAVQALPAAVRVLILDACQAGVLTREKGGRSGQGFSLALGADEQTRGLAILAASAGSELAQESDQLGGAVFTHYLHLGLSGLADRNRDGSVSLTEAFAYTSERTVAATLGTTTGPQHPTYRLDLNGSDDLLLTRPGVSGIGYGHIRLDVPGWYFIRRSDGTVAAEVVSRGGELLAFDPGSYEITRRGRSNLDVGVVSVAEGRSTPVSGVATSSVAFGQMVRKGGGAAAVAFGLSAGTTARTSIAELGPSLGLQIVGRVDFSVASLELRLGLGQARHAGARLLSTTWEGTASVALLRVHDLGVRGRGLALAVAGGIEAGVSRMAQRIDGGDRHSSWSPLAGPTLLVDTTFSRRFYLRVGLGAPVYALRVQTVGGVSTTWRPALSAVLGAGTWF